VAAPSKVEFPGKKKTRAKMRGTKQANEATAKKLARELGQFRENPRGHLPAMTFQGRLRWGRVDPVTKTLSEIEKIIRKKDDLKWLSKRMMAKRGDDVAKAFAGSLHAAHDEQFTMVGQFNSGSFGSGSYVRRGDGKPGYLAGIQNYANMTLRMLPWEDHAKRGMYFFSWDGGFVCTGPNADPPEPWLADVLARSRFNLEMHDVNDHPVWVSEGLDAEGVVASTPSEQGHVTLRFHNGSVVGLGLDDLQTFSKKDSPFVHHLALSMLPPILPSILSMEAVWSPQGWPIDRPLPQASLDGIERVLDAWQGLTMNEGIVCSAIKQTVMEAIDEGILIDECWMDGTSQEAIEQALEDTAGSAEERLLTSQILHLALTEPHEDAMNLRIEAKGTPEDREEGCLRVMKGATCGDVLSAFWTPHGQAALGILGLEGDEAEAIWEDQRDSPKPFGKFLKGLDKAKALARQKARFPSCDDESGPARAIRDYIVNGLLQGMGAVERQATARHHSVDSAAAAWAWLVAVGRSGGQEWHFDTNARDRGGVWAIPTKALWEVGKQLLEVDEAALLELQGEWADVFETLKTTTGSA
jgi:gluconate kinase